MLNDIIVYHFGVRVVGGQGQERTPTIANNCKSLLHNCIMEGMMNDACNNRPFRLFHLVQEISQSSLQSPHQVPTVR
jgi:hypothetical protein